MALKSFFVNIIFDNHLIYGVDVKAKNKPEAYRKAKTKLAKQLFKESKLKNYDKQRQRAHGFNRGMNGVRPLASTSGPRYIS